MPSRSSVNKDLYSTSYFSTQVSMYRPRPAMMNTGHPEKVVCSSDSGELRDSRMHQQRVSQRDERYRIRQTCTLGSKYGRHLIGNHVTGPEAFNQAIDVQPYAGNWTLGVMEIIRSANHQLGRVLM